MGRDHFRRIRDVFESASELPEAERAEYISGACCDDASMIAEVRRMLAADEEAFPLLDDIGQRGGGLQPGEAFAGHYIVGALIGRGGMGDVYRCRDTVLNREVALKVLPTAVGQDGSALGRFRREAQTLASLNHPNIAAIYSVEESGGLHALALELVEGATLADRITRGAVPVEEALPIARQIADALESAHEAGVMHRDLKPANVKLRPDGSVKVLDFGLAKDWRKGGVLAPKGTGEIGGPLITDGRVMMGTPAYMSPEQARGDQVDRRADIWAFGVVLYEMLCGRPLFEGRNTSETLEEVLGGRIDWSRLPAAVPPEVRKLIERSLDRDHRHRLRDIGEARIVLEAPPSTQNEQIHRPRPVRVIAAAFVGALLVVCAGALISLKRPTYAVTRLSILLPDSQTPFLNRSTTAVSPDGRRIVYATTAGLRLRNLSSLVTLPVRGTESFFNITEPAFSPDGKWIVFHTGSDQTLKRIPTEGGSASKVCDSLGPSSVTWAPEGILFVEPGQAELAAVRRAEDRPRDGILLVSPAGGEPKHLVRMRDREVVHGPQLLTGGRHLLFTLSEWNSLDTWDNARIVVEDLTTGERKVILQGGSDARYLPTGHLVYAVAGSLFAAPFELRRLKVTGTAAPVVEGVQRAVPESTGGAHYTVASNGALIYVPGPVTPSKEIAISDRKGGRETLPLPPRMYETPRASPTGRQIAFGISERNRSDIFVYDLFAKTAMLRLTLQGNNRLPVWSSDGTRIAFQSDREGDRSIFWQRADGSGAAVRLTTAAKDEAHEPEAWSAEYLLFCARKGSGAALYMLSTRDGKARPFGDVRSSTPTGATLSPDRKWVAYAATKGGRTTFTVQPFPPTGATYEFVAQQDGKPNHPQWSRDGREIFFNPGPGQFKSVPVVTRPAFRFGQAVPLPRPFGPAHTLKPRAYDVLPDGRFLGVHPAAQDIAAGQIVVVLDWFAELRSRVPPAK